MKWFLKNTKNKRILFFGDEIAGSDSYADKIEKYFSDVAPQYGIETEKQPLSCEGELEKKLDEAADNILKSSYDAVVFYFGAEAWNLNKDSDEFFNYTNEVKNFAKRLREKNILTAAITPAPFFRKDYDDCDKIKKYADFICELENTGEAEAAVDVFCLLKAAQENESTTKNDIHELVAKAVLKTLFNITLTGDIGKFSDGDYHGFVRKNFYFEGREASFILPKMFAAGRPWIWRAEFLGAFDSADVAMLENGWGLAYINLNDMYGSGEALEIMRRFQNKIVSVFELYERCVMFGFSRGGLYSVNYAARYGECVCGLYLDNPVMDIYSWPGGFGNGCSDTNSEQWRECEIIFGVDASKESRESFKDNPKDKISKLLENNIPIMLVAGGADSVVPYFENGRYIENEYLENGGTLKLYLESWRDHHPHSLEKPEEIVRFIISDMSPDIY